MHLMLVNRLGGLSLPRNAVVRLTDRLDMTIAVHSGRISTTHNTFTHSVKSETTTNFSRKCIHTLELLYKFHAGVVQPWIRSFGAHGENRYLYLKEMDTIPLLLSKCSDLTFHQQQSNTKTRPPFSLTRQTGQAGNRSCDSWRRGCKTFSMLNSAEHEILNAHIKYV